MEQDKNQNTSGRKVLRHWHTIFGTFLDKRLKPANIQVELEVKAAKSLPAMDILLLRPQSQSDWTQEQRALLPDGLRSCGSSRIVIEFKYSESFGTEAVIQAQVYDWLYRKSEHLAKSDVSTFLVCSKSPNHKRLAELSYVPSGFPGVYTNTHGLGKRIGVIALNELSDEDHNLAFKLFASKNRIRNQSLENLKRAPLISEEAVYFLNALKVQWQDKGAQLMMISMTEKEILEYGKSLSELILNNVSYEMRLKGIPASERLKDIPASERLKDIPASERLKDIPASERLKDIPASELFRNIPADELRALILKDEQLRDLLQPS
jgi:hypothetical protein